MRDWIGKQPTKRQKLVGAALNIIDVKIHVRDDEIPSLVDQAHKLWPKSSDSGSRELRSTVLVMTCNLFDSFCGLHVLGINHNPQKPEA